MKLLGQARSINVRKVLWTCAELGLSVDREDWGGETQSTTSQDFLEVNPKGLVPVLVEGDRVLSESNTICRYLARREKRADILPVSAFERAEVEAWMDWQATELNTAWRAAFMGLVRKHPDYTDPQAIRASADTWNAAMALVEAQLAATGAYVCGAQFTLADIVLGLSTNRWERTPIEHKALPAVKSWMDRMADRPGFLAYCRNGVA